MKNTQELLNILTLDDLGEGNFNGVSRDIGSPNVFGGQVLAQALNAAYRTTPKERILHSLHSYFLEAGNLELPITYNVQTIRDGGSFSTRRVTAHQKDKTIFILSCSFHKKEDGYEHQMPIKKDLKQPEELLSWTDMLDQFGAFLPKKMKDFLSIERPIDFKPVQIVKRHYSVLILIKSFWVRNISRLHYLIAHNLLSLPLNHFYSSNTYDC